MLKVEFFHDVICSFCFPMSARMHKMQEKYPNIEVNHRSFALGWEVSDFERQFGSHEAVKPEVVHHWEVANQNDEGHRFNIEGMKESNMLFPTSKPGLIAAKAAGIVGGNSLYWEVFDRLQTALFVENKGIANHEIIESLVKETSASFTQWQAAFNDPLTEEKVMADLELVRAYGINGAPALIINQKYLVSGAQPIEDLEKVFEQIASEENVKLK